MICDTIDLSWEVVVYNNNNIMPMDVGGRDVVDRYLPKVSTYTYSPRSGSGSGKLSQVRACERVHLVETVSSELPVRWWPTGKWTDSQHFHPLHMYGSL